MKLRKIETLETFASNVIGDGKSPDLFFVSDQGVCITVTRSFETAYRQWRELAHRSPFVECALENRTVGVLCSVEPTSDEPGARLEIRDDSRMLRRAA